MIAMRAWRVGGSRERLPGYLVQFGSAVGISGGGIGDDFDLRQPPPPTTAGPVEPGVHRRAGACKSRAADGCRPIYQELGCCGVGRDDVYEVARPSVGGSASALWMNTPDAPFQLIQHVRLVEAVDEAPLNPVL